jgi:DNA-binding winged helix-turn-helix (wHTH) protein/TolB-like protein/tetratricopeptide (TPR) repeat protein
MSSIPDRFAFGEFVLDTSQRRLQRADGEEIGLTPRLFNALSLFVQRAGDLLDKDELMRTLWPSLVVEENNLSQVVFALRRVLGDDGSRFIQTVPRQGFRFVATVTTASSLDHWPVVPSARSVAEGEQEGANLSSGARTRAVLANNKTLQAAVGATFATSASDDKPSDAVLPLANIAGAAPPSAQTGGRSGGLSRRRGMLGALSAGAAAAFGAVGWWAWARRRPAAGTVPPATLAVLPFKPLQPESRDQLLELGMADSLATRLSTVPGLAVRSIGSVARYAGLEQDLGRAARELDVAWIIDGSLQRRGDQLRVTARLVRTSDWTAAWSGTFDEQFTSVFDVQDQIAGRVRLALLSVLEPGTLATLPLASAGEIGGTRNVEAYRLFLQAHAQMLNQRADGLRNSIALFRNAIDADPGYALAWSGLADAHSRQAFIGDTESGPAFAALDTAARKAIALAPSLGDPRVALGYKLYNYDYDWAGAEDAFRRGIALNSNVARAHLALGQILLMKGSVESLAELRQARELDPLQPIFNAVEAFSLYNTGRTSDGWARLKRTLEIAPKLPLAFLTKAHFHFCEQQPEGCIAAMRQAVAVSGGADLFDALLGHYLGRVGQFDEARDILGRLLEHARTRYVAGTALATVLSGVGDVDRALAALDQAYTQRDPRLVFIKDAPYWSPLRGHPRYTELLKRLALDTWGPGVPHL